MKFFRFSIFLAIGLLLSGCESLKPYFSDHAADEPAMNAVYWDGPRVRPGVALIIQIGTGATQPSVFNVLVDQGGEITLPLLLQEPVACDGLTLDALKKKLIRAYSEYYRQPQVTVTFAPYDGSRGSVSPWGTVKVLGEVGSPGPVNMPPTFDLTVTKALQMAGGTRAFADLGAIRVTRCDKDGHQNRMTVDITEIGKEGRADMDLKLVPGDVIWVPERWY